MSGHGLFFLARALPVVVMFSERALRPRPKMRAPALISKRVRREHARRAQQTATHAPKLPGLSSNYRVRSNTGVRYCGRLDEHAHEARRRTAARACTGG